MASARSLGVTLSAYLLLAASAAHTIVFGISFIQSVRKPELYEMSLPPEIPFAFLRAALLMLAAPGLFGLVTGAALLKRKNWARIATMVIAALILVQSFLGLGLAGLLLSRVLVVDGVGPTPSSTGTQILAISVALAVLAVFWLVLLNRPRAKAEFHETSLPLNPASAVEKPKCPPQLTLFAWLMIITGGLSLLAAPIIAWRLPLLFFGYVVHGGPNAALWCVNGVILLSSGIGMLFLRRWSYTLAIIFHAFWIAASAISVFTPAYAGYEREILANLQLPGEPNFAAAFMPTSPWISAAWIVIPGCLLLWGLFHYRGEFNAACNAADQRGRSL